MPTLVQGELVRHHNKPFYAQQKAPKFFWAGCTGPLLLLVIIGFFVLKGATTATGLEVIRGFVLFSIVFLAVQLLFGGGLFIKSKSSLGRGLLVGAGVILLVLILGVIGLFSMISQFIG